MGVPMNWGDVGGVAMGAAITLLALHSVLGLALRARAVLGWRSVEGLLQYFNDFEIDFYRRGRAAYNGTGVEAQYKYSYGQAGYEGKYVSVLDFPPRLWTTEYKHLVPDLKAAYQDKKPITVLVNPEQPHQAVLSIEPVSGAVMKSLLALLVGGCLLWFNQMQMVSGTSWIYGGAAGFLIYLLFALGWLSTAF